LVSRLRALADERADLLNGQVSSFAELRSASPDAAPAVVLLIDGWDQLSQDFQGNGDRVRTDIIRLAEEGPSLGIQIVVSGGKAVIDTKLVGALEQVLCLRFELREDYSQFGVPLARVPKDGPPAGRAYVPGRGNAVQIAMLDQNLSTDAQNRVLARLAETPPPPAARAPFRLDDLPGLIGLDQALALPGASGGGRRSFIAAVGGDQLSCRVVDLDDLHGPFVVAGPGGSGRTGALVAIARQLSSRGNRVVVIPGLDGERARFGAAEFLDPRNLGDPVQAAIYLIDDAGRFPDFDPFLSAVVADPTARLVLAGEPGALGGYSGWRASSRSAGCGLLFSAQFGEGELIGSTLTMDQVFRAGPGRAYLGRRGAIELVQVPFAG
jgi:S-DNA-T family DNA segregation ATPase FtsK/SpoIIIE